MFIKLKEYTPGNMDQVNKRRCRSLPDAASVKLIEEALAVETQYRSSLSGK